VGAGRETLPARVGRRRVRRREIEMEKLCMDETMGTTPTPKTTAEYRAVVDDLLRQMACMHEQMAENQLEIERTRAESAAIRADTDLILASIDTRLAAIDLLL
jgi:hypothetical protein